MRMQSNNLSGLLAMKLANEFEPMVLNLLSGAELLICVTDYLYQTVPSFAKLFTQTTMFYKIDGTSFRIPKIQFTNVVTIPIKIFNSQTTRNIAHYFSKLISNQRLTTHEATTWPRLVLGTSFPYKIETLADLLYMGSEKAKAKIARIFKVRIPVSSTVPGDYCVATP